MIKTLATIAKDNWGWRKQVCRLALFDLKKQSRGAVLGWAWLFIKPAVYIFCFWFALRIGLRSGSSDPSAPPYILWLSAGLIPWFFMQDMLGGGVNVLRKYPYLVNKIKFPLSAISSIYAGGTMITQAFLTVALLGIYFACGMPVSIYLLQIPILMLLMLMFWIAFSIMLSQLSAISKDVANLMKALGTPIFWLSGIIFDTKSIGIGWIQTILHYNPVTFFCSSYRMALYDQQWFWQDPSACSGFVIVFVVTVVLMAIVYQMFNEEVADVF